MIVIPSTLVCPDIRCISSTRLHGLGRARVCAYMADQPNLAGAAIFYIIYTAGLLFFVVQNTIATGTPAKALIAGALSGLVCYATYDLSSLAALKNWSLPLTVVDMVWGSFASGIAAMAGAYAVRF